MTQPAHHNTRRLVRCITAALLATLLLLTAGCAGTQKTGLDTSWTDNQKDIYSPEPGHKGLTQTSMYLPMRDGVKIAMDIYLPADLKPGEKIPTILMQTRYFRMFDFYWPYNKFMNMNKEMEQVTSQGYALVRLDARGTGASFGTRPCPWSEDETKDGAEVVDWIISQNWSNGNVGAVGGSYEGTTAEFLLVNRHPAVKAIVPMYSLYDAYTDIAFPGGIQLEWFTSVWERGNGAMDANNLRDAAWYAPLFTRGVTAVDGDKGRKLLEQAVKEHETNYHVHKEASQITYRDDVSSGGVFVDSFSPHTFLEEIMQSGAAIYNYSGWFDGGYPHAAIKRYLTLGGEKDRLILGPWNHGGDQQVRPHGKTLPSEFDHIGEIIRFFDYHLKGIETGPYDEYPVHYFTMGENRWKAATTWPPPGVVETILYLDTDHGLSWDKPINDSSDSYQVDLSTGTGKTTRWNCLAKALTVSYPDRKAKDKKLLVYDSGPLEQDMEVTGHPIMKLYLSSSKTDAQVFVYLEDIDKNGHVGYVTEGQLRAKHRKLSADNPPYKTPTPYRTFERKDSLPLIPGGIAELTFDLQPVSHQFKKGHRIRVAIAGADSDLFKNLDGQPPLLGFYRGGKYPSQITLPVMPSD